VDADEANGLSGVSGYYCSEAIWAAYKSTAGIELDPAGDSWDWSTAYGVSPTDIYDDSDSSIVSSQGWDPDECYYVSVWVEGIYYDDDYAPWTEGSDEQYYKYAVGDDWGGSGYKTGDGRDDQRSSDDNGEHVMWNEYLKGGDGLNMMIPKTHPLTIGIEAWEADGFLNSDDQYPVFDWSTEDMENFVFKPDGEDSQGEYQWDVDEDGNQYKWRGWWWWNYWDAGDCRYCIMFTVQDEPIDASDCPGYSTEYYA
jgi:hypothetical protein